MSDNIVQLDVIRIERNKHRNCTCDHHDKKFVVDSVNREVTCGCGLTVDPYEALEYLARHYDRINEQHKSMDEQRKQWAKEKPYSVLFKRLERDYQRGTMLPFCPNCNQLVDFKDMTRFGNAEFYRKLQARSAIKATE